MLIIRINEYKDSLRIPNLEGGVSDVDDVRNYQQKSLGVPSSQIKNLRNSEAARAAIIDGSRPFNSTTKLKRGDPILIYFARHGCSADTPEGWEDWSTGKIKLLIQVLYNSDHSSRTESQWQSAPWGFYFRNLQSRRVIIVSSAWLRRC